MKKIFVLAALAAMVFASCSKDGGTPQPEITKTKLVVKITGVKAAPVTRAADAVAAETGQLKLSDGWIFVIDSRNDISYSEELELDTPLGAGAAPDLEQELDQEVSSDERVYVIGNFPSDVDPGDLKSWSDIQEAVSAISNNIDYTDAALANGTGEPVTLTPGEEEGTATATVQLVPLYSRMELARIVGGEHIISFNVAGVYVDDYYNAFTMTGAPSGEQQVQGQGTELLSTADGGMGDEGVWASSSKLAFPGSVMAPKIWAYHMASAGLPRFVIHLTEVNYYAKNITTEEYDIPAVLPGDRYLTVTGYTNEGFTEFERGKIYRIGGSEGITFDEDRIGNTPNPETVVFTVGVDVVDWEAVVLTPEL